MQLPSFRRSLSARLLVLTVGFVMLAEVLIYLPSAARFRHDWLAQRLGAAHLAALSLVAATERGVGRELEEELLRHVGAHAVDVQIPDARVLMLMNPVKTEAEARFDLTAEGPLEMIASAFDLLFSSGDRLIAVHGISPADGRVRVGILIGEAPLRHALQDYSTRILILSIVISLFTAGLVYVALHVLTVRPMRRLVESMIAFKQDPESEAPAVQLATDREDEVGIAQRELIAMQAAVRMALRQRERLAALGTAVAKINHDIRGILANATLLSERLLDSEDPGMRRTGPRLLASLERAAQLCGQTLAYSRDGVMPLRRRAVKLHSLVQHAACDFLPDCGEAVVGFVGKRPVLVNEVPEDLVIQADEEQLCRVIANLGRNAVEAGATQVTIAATPLNGRVELVMRDDGPGLPPRAREHLFEPFNGSSKPNGTGLGLAIAREVMRAHGGEIRLLETSGGGTSFGLSLPATGMQG